MTEITTATMSEEQKQMKRNIIGRAGSIKTDLGKLMANNDLNGLVLGDVLVTIFGIDANKGGESGFAQLFKHIEEQDVKPGHALIEPVRSVRRLQRVRDMLDEPGMMASQFKSAEAKNLLVLANLWVAYHTLEFAKKMKEYHQ